MSIINATQFSQYYPEMKLDLTKHPCGRYNQRKVLDKIRSREAPQPAPTRWGKSMMQQHSNCPSVLFSSYSI